MGGRTDVVKGRIKEAAGALTGNDKLRVEGKTDQVVGKTKLAVHKAACAVKKAVKKVTGVSPARLQSLVVRQEKPAEASTGHWKLRNGDCPDFCLATEPGFAGRCSDSAGPSFAGVGTNQPQQPAIRRAVRLCYVLKF